MQLFAEAFFLLSGIHDAVMTPDLITSPQRNPARRFAYFFARFFQCRRLSSDSESMHPALFVQLSAIRAHVLPLYPPPALPRLSNL